MPVMILMPALSPTMEMGTLAKWYVTAGDSVIAGDILADIETDKATMEFEAIEDGKVTNLLVAEGTANIPVNQAIAELTLSDEDVSPKRELSLTGPDIVSQTNIEGTSLPENLISAIKSQVSKSQSTKSINRVKISPLAKQLALKQDVNISSIQGSGPHGRIIKKDVVQYLNQEKESTLSNTTSDDHYKTLAPKDGKTAATLENTFHDRDHSLIQLSGVRKIIANRLSEAKRTIPHFYLRKSIHLDKLLNLRSELNDSFQDSTTKFSINDFIIKAVAKSLQDNPKCNAIWGEDYIMQLKSSDISVAVALEDGLITPIIRDAEKKTLQEISIEMKEKAKKAKAKKLLPEEYTGGSCSISNLGMMGIETFDAVINPPQASILAVGTAVKKPLVGTDGEIRVGHAMSMTLSADHRVIDGAVGAAFISCIVEYLSNPLKLMI